MTLGAESIRPQSYLRCVVEKDNSNLDTTQQGKALVPPAKIE